jgi:propane monooxygenase coupling protein
MTDVTVSGAPADDQQWGVSYDYVGIVMQRTPEGEAVGRVCSRESGVEVIENTTFLDVRAKDRLFINFDDVSEELGSEMDGYRLQEHMTTHYGRMAMTDDAFVLVANPLELIEMLDAEV